MIVDVNARKAQRGIALPDWVAFVEGLGGGRPAMTPYRISWSPDNRHVLVCWLQTVIVDADSGQVVRELKDQPFVEWTGKGDSVFHAVGQSDAQREVRPAMDLIVDRVNVRTGERTPILSAKDAAALKLSISVRSPHVVLSPGGRRLAILGFDSNGSAASLFIYELAGGTEFAPLEPAARFSLDFKALFIDWSPAGDALAAVAIGDSKAEVRVLDVAQGTWTTVGTIGQITGVAEIDALAFYKMMSWSR
jgi:hypothetical protein